MKPQKFLTELKSHDKIKYAIVKNLRNLVLTTNKNVIEEVKYGGLLYSNEKPYTGLFVSKGHVSMEFSEGATLTDPKKILLGNGKYRRHLKFASTDDIVEKEILQFLKQSLK